MIYVYIVCDSEERKLRVLEVVNKLRRYVFRIFQKYNKFEYVFCLILNKQNNMSRMDKINQSTENNKDKDIIEQLYDLVSTFLNKCNKKMVENCTEDKLDSFIEAPLRTKVFYMILLCIICYTIYIFMEIISMFNMSLLFLTIAYNIYRKENNMDVLWFGKSRF